MNLKILTDASEQLLSPENSMLMSKSPQLKKRNIVKMKQKKNYLIII